MAASYSIVKSAHLKYVKVAGRTDFKELETLFYRYVRDPDFEPTLRLLVDLREMTDAVAGLWEMSKLKRLYQYAYCDARNEVDVVIVTRGKIAHRAAKLFAFFMRDRKPMNIQITDNFDDALARLKIRPEVLSGVRQAKSEDTTLRMVHSSVGPDK